jgi:uncharacterized protein (TIGR00295 family)
MDQKEALRLLRKYASDEMSYRNVLAHGRKVREVAMRIAKTIPGADRQLISTAALLHDIGRFQHYRVRSIRHGIYGGYILRKEGYPLHARVAERHIGAGITKEDIRRQKLCLPEKDYVPRSVEEKIICYADKLVDNDKEIGLGQVVGRYTKELGEPYALRIVRLKKEIDRLSRACPYRR